MRTLRAVLVLGTLAACVGCVRGPFFNGYIVDDVTEEPIEGATIIIGEADPYFHERKIVNPERKVIDKDGPMPSIEWGRVKSDGNGWCHWEYGYGVSPAPKLVFKIVKEGYAPLYPASRTTPLDPVTERKDDGTPIWKLKPLKSGPLPTQPD